MSNNSGQSHVVAVAALVLGAWSVSRTAPELIGGVSTTAAGRGLSPGPSVDSRPSGSVLECSWGTASSIPRAAAVAPSA
jgi:hypothetical protein